MKKGELKKMRDDVTKKIGEAKRQVVEGSLTIWNARLELLKDAGDVRGVLDHLNSALEDKINNCGCNNGCPVTRDLGGATVNPVIGSRNA